MNKPKQRISNTTPFQTWEIKSIWCSSCWQPEWIMLSRVTAMLTVSPRSCSSQTSSPCQALTEGPLTGTNGRVNSFPKKTFRYVEQINKLGVKRPGTPGAVPNYILWFCASHFYET